MQKAKNWLWIFNLLFIGFSCGPKVYYFKPEQSKISTGDTVKLHWKVRGKPVMLVHEKTSADDPANIKPGEKLMEFMIGFENSDKYGAANVIVTPKETSDTLFFRTVDIIGDTLIATGTKLPEQFFAIHSITSIMNRIIIVWHQNKMIVLLHPGSSSLELDNNNIGGEWKIGTLLTPAEKKDPTVAPAVLKILLNKKHV